MCSLCAGTISPRPEAYARQVSNVRPHPKVARLAEAIDARMDEVVDRLTARVIAEMEPYRTGLVSPEEVRRSMAQNFQYMVDHLKGTAGPDLSAPRETGLRRGRAGVPLPELLRAYRIGFAELWRLLVEEARRSGTAAYESLIDAATDIWSLADDYSQAVTDAYREAQSDRIFEQARRRAALIEAVVTGDITDQGTLWEIADQLRMPFEGVFLVVAAETASIAEDPLGRVEPRLAALDVASAWRLLPGIELGLISLGRASRGTAALGLITDLSQTRVGVSPQFTRLDGAPPALRLARIAMTSVPPSTVGVQQFDASPLGALIAADPESAKRIARTILGPVLDLPAEERDTLLSTLDAWFSALGSATATGREIYVHPNTVRHRLKRIEQHTGRSLDNPRAVAELAVALNATHLFPDLTP